MTLDLTKTPTEDGGFNYSHKNNKATFDGETLTLTAFTSVPKAAEFLSTILVLLAEDGVTQVVLPDAGDRAVYPLLGFAVDRDRSCVWEPVFRGKLHEREVVPPTEQAAFLAGQTTVVYKATKRLTKKERVTKKLFAAVTAKPKVTQRVLFTLW